MSVNLTAIFNCLSHRAFIVCRVKRGILQTNPAHSSAKRCKYLVPMFACAGLLGMSCSLPDETMSGEATSTEDVDSMASDSETGNSTTSIHAEEISTEYASIRLIKIAEPFAHPWAVALLPDGRMLVTEREGRLNLVEEGDVIEISGVPDVNTQGQGGLLDVVIHPDYEENGWVYLTYSQSNGNNETATALVRGQLDGSTLINVEELFVQNRYSSPGRHYGSRLTWTNDGKLLMSIGDRGTEPTRAQDLNDHAGTLLRLNDDGSIPDDNPFVGQNDVLDEIYAYGLRNVQGLVVDPETGDIWVTDHGPRGGDEINLIEAGNNYGWPLVTLGLDYGTEGEFPDAVARRMEGMTEPFHEFLPTHAPSGLALVRSNQFPAWNGNLLAGGLRSERIRRVVLGDEEVLHEEELLLQKIGRIRDVREGPDGNLYVLNDEPVGALYRIEPAN